ncbi:hypothetical protein OIU84_015988 [Salix udensis]|uniref:Uncharacterized protein n=1 Tax=Salix udensis TaxID=889485 RepID=A0AAD6NPW7_9ROSI|nr:hypothetical protein OIU84_015988 [Salix udensis]
MDGSNGYQWVRFSSSTLIFKYIYI